MTDYVKSENNEVITDPTERFIIKLDDIKQSMGLWYSLFALRVIPFMLFIIPINVVLETIYTYVEAHFIPGAHLNGTFLLVTWIISMAVFLALTIFTPRIATIAEFLIGAAYLFIAFREHLFNNILGYSVLIGMMLFLLVKLVFLVFKIIRMRAFADDAKNHIERDESGRVVRKTGEDVFFTKTEDEPAPGEDGVHVAVSDDVFYAKNDDIDTAPSVAADDEFLFVKNDTADEERPAPVDNDFFFAKADDNQPEPANAPDDDFFFG